MVDVLSAPSRAASGEPPAAPLFTVFTPTFNRVATLHRVYDSLRAQTLRDFEWVVVDDGSSDGTDALIAGWKAEADFPITYVWQENRGKHTAFNRGAGLARGELFLPLDSDDACVPAALERFKHHWDQVKHDPGFSAVTALAGDPDGRLVGSRFPLDPTDSDSLEIRYRHKVRGDKWGFHRLAVIREHPFPEPEGVKFVPEGLVWSRIARRYKTRYVNEPLLVVHTTGGDRLTVANPIPSAEGRLLYYREVLNHELGWFWSAPLQFLRAATNNVRYATHLGLSLTAQGRVLARSTARALWLVGLPAGALLAWRDRAQFGKR
ncbi:glycosyltransferase family 2 protein [Caulobacter sp. 17J80-11]|uniref:glycosyltransferase family 2 protein n=1 Tax=Caulobacter sp. 17J80-11 TaxID=2763502 RepID=UPI00165369EF|nr:glycosyltransferase family 2 protein [Caulobacter sp. 17J80-11]MBC6982109.1 glycosyltransferase family 2 protein [Caulobacter sp. 17J80-11]